MSISGLTDFSQYKFDSVIKSLFSHSTEITFLPLCGNQKIINLMPFHFLSFQSYTMRNGVLGVIGEIVIRVLSKEQLDKKAKTARDQLLDKLEVRLRQVKIITFSIPHSTCLW